MTQARSVAELLAPRYGEIEIVKIRTSGDEGNRDGLGAFVSEIQQATLRGDVDFGLHCLKDLPTTRPEGLRLAAHLERGDPRDAILTRGRSWLDLKRLAVVGTGSVRRTAQLAAHRPDLRFKPLVGNVDTRMGKLLNGEYDAIVLAMAGLARLGLVEGWHESAYRQLNLEPLPTSVMLPAPGQAVLVLECREDDQAVESALSPYNHLETERCSTAERAFLGRFGGGCSVPVAAHGEIRDGILELQGSIASPDGTRVIRGTGSGSPEDASEIGIRLAEGLGNRGGFEVVDSVARFAEAPL